MKKPSVLSIMESLEKQYGKREIKPHHDPIAELVLTILSQNTSDINSRPAFKSLTTSFPTWEQVLQAKPVELAETIRRGGLARIKASRIQQSLLEINRRKGTLDLAFLKNMPISEARDWLMELPGVGSKTASCVLLFAMGRPTLPVDTHIFRLSKRLGLINNNSSLRNAHIFLESVVPPDLVYEFHVLMIEHGRRICIARRPRCPECTLNPVCPSNNIFETKPVSLKMSKNER
jgi:endonuclease III